MKLRKTLGKNEKGATLVEVLAALIIASLVISTVTYVIQYALQNYRHATERQHAQADALFITETIVKAVRERSNQTLTIDEAASCKLKIQSSETTFTCFNFNAAAHTLHMTKVEDNTTEINVLLSDTLQAFEVEIDDANTKLDLSLSFNLMKNTTFTHETAVYVPYL